MIINFNEKYCLKLMINLILHTLCATPTMPFYVYIVSLSPLGQLEIGYARCHNLNYAIYEQSLKSIVL